MGVIAGPSVEFIDKAVLAPLTNLELAKGGKPGRFDGGVYRSDGSICELSLTMKGSYENIPAPTTPPARDLLSGSHIFGGMLQNTHFGHFAAESLARIWPLPELGDRYEKLLLFPRIVGKGIPSWAQQLFDLVVGPDRVRLIAEPTKIERLAVPSQMADRIGTVQGRPLMRSAVEKLRDLGSPAKRRLYVSRSALSAAEGGFLLENEVERRLQRDGYEVIHPERMSIREQFEAYNSAEKLIFSEGSALHLYAFVARPDQQVFILWRRKSGPTFINQIRSFGGSTAVGQPAIRQLYEPEMDYGARARAKALLDFPAIGNQMRAAGFIDSDADWSDPSSDAIAEAIERAAAAIRKPFREVAL